MLIFRFADATECGAEAHADAVLWLFPRIFDPGVIERELGRSHRKLRIPIEPLQTLWRKEFLRIPVADFSGATHLERLRIKSGNAANPSLLGKDAVPKVFPSMPDASDGTNSGDDCAPSTHAATLFACAST
jgi:hypothetical protein